MNKPSHREEGLLAGGEVLFGGVVIMLLATMLVINLWLIIDAKVAVSAASREGARRAVEADTAEGALAAIKAAAASAAAGHHRNIQVAVAVDGSLATRCSTVRVRVGSDVDLIVVPGWRLGFTKTRVSSTHTETVDGYRSGLPGEARCA